MHIFVVHNSKFSVMKRLFTIFTAAIIAFSFSACDLLDRDGGRDTDNTIIRPDSNKPNNSDDDNKPENDNNNTGNNGPENNESDRSNYQTYNQTFTQGQAGYYGVYYEGQPTTTANWYLELADNNYDLESYEGTGFNAVIEFFASNSSTTSIPAGEYTVEAFDNNPFSAGSLLYGFLGEYEENGETIQYPAGTWLFEGDEAVAGATAGKMTVSRSGNNYSISYVLHDDEFEVTFKGTYSGSLSIYDGTEGYSLAAQAKVAKAPRADLQVKRYRVRR